MKKFGYIITLMIILTLIYLNGCKNDYPPSLWDPNIEAKPDPVITDIEPDSTFGGIGIIDILGKNFSDNVNENSVYFNGEKGSVLEASSSVLKVKVPNIYGDSVKIQLRVVGALLFAEYYPYKLGRVAIEYGDFTEYDDAYAMALDKEENLYVSLMQDNKGKKKKIVKVNTAGERSDFASTLLDKASGMRMGPDGSLYYVNLLTAVLKVAPQGGTDAIYKVLPGGVYDLDFDQNFNIYLAGISSKVFRIKPDKSAAVVANYDKISFRGVRVFNDYVYLIGSYTGSDSTRVQEGLWRNPILSAEGDLGEAELVFDWRKHFPDYNLLSMAIAKDGDILLGTDGAETIIVLHPDGSFEPLYPGVLEPPASVMVWGNGNYLYVNRRSVDGAKKRIIRINLLKEGAPYYGRQ